MAEFKEFAEALVGKTVHQQRKHPGIMLSWRCPVGLRGRAPDLALVGGGSREGIGNLGTERL